MFRIGSGRTTWVNVSWQGLADDGSPVQNEMQCKLTLVDRKELAGQITAEQEGEGTSLAFAQRVTTDWKGVGDAEGNRMAFSAERLGQLFEAPGYAAAWGRAYLQAWNGVSGIRAGNSEPSPAAGQAAGAATPAAAA